MVQGDISKENMEELQKGEPHFHLRKEGFVSDRDAENKAEKKWKITLGQRRKCYEVYMIKNNSVSLLLRNRESMPGEEKDCC